MRREWEPEDLVGAWTLVEGDWHLVGNKTGHTRLGFVLLLKFFELEGRFPRHAGELPPAAVAYVAAQVRVEPALFGDYAWAGRTIEYHRAQIREALGFRPATRADEQALADWLATDVAPFEASDERLREALLARCRTERLEPPGRPDRLIASARATAADRFCAVTVARLDPAVAARLEALVAEVDPGAAALGERGLLAELKADPGRASLETLLGEIDKLERVRGLGLPATLFTGATDTLVCSWRARAAQEYPSDLRTRSPQVRLTLLATLCFSRTSEITDTLIELFLDVVHKIGTRAERQVETELREDLRRVRGKEGILFRLAEAALEHPEDTVRTAALFPVVGEATLRELVREAKATDTAFRSRVRTVLRSSYSTYYRRMLPRLLATLEFRSNNSAHQPIIDAVALLRTYSTRPGVVRHYAPGDAAPLEGIVPAEWRDAVVGEDGRIERVPYELCVLRALRDGIRRREVWVPGAGRWRNPERDLPADFEDNRGQHYAALRQPADPSAFIAALEQQMRTCLHRLQWAQQDGTSGGVRFTTRGGEPWIGVPKLDTLPEPVNLGRLKDAVQARWGTVDLLDLLKEADLLTGFTEEFTSVASREVIPRRLLRRRLLLVLFGLGTNMGIKRIAAGEHGETEAALRHVRRLFLNPDNLRRAVTRLVNATFAVRDTELWGTGTACASDSKKFGAWSSNLMTE